ncbi:probable glycosyl transferase [Psychrobacter arcticus 273-4]|uniref:Probable glycosyl transferase n=1 Tax=Psychrobacter arcticus (strain DSM 17307 / VKM B-2377 / 273-4) TaxID=259536 RepID=Q4FTZ4_PSYA2|nr:glycosyltransferase family 2 protein [Psychrobacter arcticus]AAZ18514.1 probable glycosyl transferase [Psychrobacter arcticus 273-4]
MHYLSIISPFYNSEEKCKRLLETLMNIKDEEIEIIFVDDGSTDDTVALLTAFRSESQVEVKVIRQENKGPGGARNAGLNIAKGEYVWFVDSDDDIKLDALVYLKNIYHKGYDFVDFNYISKGSICNSMEIESDSYKDMNTNREILLAKFGRIWTKIFKKDFLIKNNIYYPEYCIYEDNPLVFIYPFLCSKFLKSDIVGYIHHEEYSSITRCNPSPIFLDRLFTSVYGIREGYKLTSDINDISILQSKFNRLYLINTVGALMTKRPSKNWVMTYRVMKQYRKVAKDLKIEKGFREDLGENKKFKVYFLFHWYLSFLVFKDQTDFFEKERYKAWQKPFPENTTLSDKL